MRYWMYNISLHGGKIAPLENIRDITFCCEESRFQTENRKQECVCMITQNLKLTSTNPSYTGNTQVPFLLTVPVLQTLLSYLTFAVYVFFLYCFPPAMPIMQIESKSYQYAYLQLPWNISQIYLSSP